MGLSERLKEDMHACGRQGPPGRIACRGEGYALSEVLKHDFFAATAIYEAEASGADLPARIICKFNRRRAFFGLPLGWLGRLVTGNECRNLLRCANIACVPKIVERLDSNTYAYAYIEGEGLRRGMTLPRDFFDDLMRTLKEVHEQNLAHLDLHKPGNLLLGEDDRAYVVDFQISVHIGERLLISRWLTTRFRRWLQSHDLYHVCKHKRRLLPSELTEAERELSYRPGLGVRVHRFITIPYRKIRRAVLRCMVRKGILASSEASRSHFETDPARWRSK
jgi:hypothetical protein